MAHDILIVDDEADIRVLTAGILEDEGYQTREAANSDTALSSIATRPPSLVILDIWLQGSDLDGLGILAEIKKHHASVPVVMISGHGTIETAVKAIKLGAYDFIEKPFKADRLVLLVERAIETARLIRENEELRSRADQDTVLIGSSSSVNQLRQTISKVAPTNSRVLISGPEGAGKEIIARLLHQQSKRAGGPFVALNCATMQPERMEIELFGTEATSDGAGRRIGKFEAAHNGTLLLDEVADMPLGTQSKIVRVLQEQTFERVGGTKTVEVDVRVVATTTTDLKKAIADGKFREDLFYRLSVVPIRVPSLLERRADIAELTDFFMDRLTATLGQQSRKFADDALIALQTYHWPGNVRELRNVLERVLIMAPGGDSEVISVDMLPHEIHSQSSVSQNWEKNGEILSLPLREAREMFEREYLLTQVARFSGNISRTAEFVGMERSALHRKLKSLGVQSGEKDRKVTV
ncbi:MAG: sigma-54 dependent transcriptional regulator [Rhodospirillales bacterium]